MRRGVQGVEDNEGIGRTRRRAGEEGRGAGRRVG